jgi:23S rRNA (pseudouridine1915-N3)-methyltransferase
MKIEIVSISDSDKHFASAIAEYVKRLGADVSLVDLKPVKHGTHEQIIAAETQLIMDQLAKRPVATYLMSKEGKQVTTEEFGALIPKHDHHLRFVIGWPYGLEEWVLTHYIQGKLAFGQITMPHGLAKLVLIEQIYRAQQIMQGRQYHY